MKKRIYGALCAAALVFSFAVTLTAMEISAFSGGIIWTCTADKEYFTVQLSVPRDADAIQQETYPALNPETKCVSEPVSVKSSHDGGIQQDVYPGGGTYLWKYRLDSLTFPLSVSMRVQACSDKGVCFLPERLSAGTYSSLDELIQACAQNEVVDNPDENGGNAGTADDSVKKPEQFELLPDFEVVRTGAGYLPPSGFLHFLRSGDAGSESVFETGAGFLYKLILAFIGGILLNLTPCVLPLIPVNLAVIGAAGKDAAAGRFSRVIRGLCYGAGILFACSALGILSIVSGTAFGGFVSSPVFRAAAAVLMLIFALALFGVFRLDFSRFRGGLHFHPGVRHGGIFLMGVLSAALAGTCVSPVLAAVLVYAAHLCQIGEYSGLLLPAALGLGAAAPWPFLAAGISLLPRPGAWMRYVNRGLGCLVLGTAVYFGYSAFCQLTRAKTEPLDPRENLISLRDALERTRYSGKQVLVLLEASWCANCSAMDNNTYSDSDVKQEMEKFHVVRLDIEDTENTISKQILSMLDVKGFPAYCILKQQVPENLSEKELPADEAEP